MSRDSQARFPVVLGIVLYEAQKWVESLTADITASLGVLSSVIVIDNGKDGAGKDLLSRVPSITLVENGSNRGHAHGVNQILSIAEERTLLLADHDVHWTPDVIVELVEALRFTDNKYWAITPVIRGKHGDLSRVESWTVGPFGTVCEFDVARQSAHLVDEPVIAAHQHSTWFCPTTFVLLDRTKHEPEMMEEYFVYWNDVDLFLNAARLGYEVLPIAAEVWHGSGSTGVAFRSGYKAPDLHEFFQTRNRWLFALTNYRMVHLLALLPVFVIIELGNLIILIKNRQFRIAVRAYVGIVACLASIVRKRRSKQWGQMSEIDLLQPSCVGIAPARLESLTQLQLLVLRSISSLFGIVFSFLQIIGGRKSAKSKLSY